MEPLPRNLAYLMVSGTLDASTYVQLEQALEKVISGGQCRIAVDLSRLDFISSAGINVLTAASKTAREKGGAMVLVNPSDKIRQVLGILCLTPLFTIVDSVHAAQQALTDPFLQP
jgi:anti-sigma B factor antagonist